MWIVLTTFFVTGSIREMVPSPLFATHTAPPPTVTAEGREPTSIVAVDPKAGSSRVTVSSPVLVTQSAPSP